MAHSFRGHGGFSSTPMIPHGGGPSSYRSPEMTQDTPRITFLDRKTRTENRIGHATPKEVHQRLRCVAEFETRVVPVLDDVVQDEVRRHPRPAFAVDDHNGGAAQSPFAPVDDAGRRARTFSTDSAWMNASHHPYARVPQGALQKPNILRIHSTDGKLVIRREPAEGPHRLDLEYGRGGPPPPPPEPFGRGWESFGRHDQESSVGNVSHRVFLARKFLGRAGAGRRARSRPGQSGLNHNEPFPRGTAHCPSLPLAMFPSPLSAPPARGRPSTAKVHDARPSAEDGHLADPGSCRRPG